MKKKEDWKMYEFDKGLDNNNQLWFSNFGEVKSFTQKHPEGNIIKGSLREGYPIISFTRFHPISDDMNALFEKEENTIKALRTENRELKKIIRNSKTPRREQVILGRNIERITKTIKKKVSWLSKQRQKDKKSRAVYFHILVHKAVAELFIPNDDPANKRFVIHKNYDKLDNQIENLAWATQEEVVKRSLVSPNFIQYTINKPKRDPHIVSKLSRNDVVLIKRKLKKGISMAKLARQFKVSDMQIYRIKKGENWGHVELSLTK